MTDGQIFVYLAVAFGFFMAWGVGANDVANAMGTSVGARALTIRRAIIIAAVFEFCGAFFAGGEVTNTISKGIIDPAIFAQEPRLLIYGMLASLLATGVWLLIATRYGWPVSTTHSIVGAIVGFTAVGIDVQAVHWQVIGSIALSWILSPLIGGILSFLLFMSVQKLIFDHPDPLRAAKFVLPFYIFLAAFIVGMVTFVQGLSHLGFKLDLGMSVLVSAIIGIAASIAGAVMIHRIHANQALDAERKSHFVNVEKAFCLLMAFTACAMAFAHGSNDVANAVGPIAAIVGIVKTGGQIAASNETPPWILLLGGAGIVAGLMMYGHKVIATIGTGITELTPSRGFAATLSAATTVVLASGTGLPISTTHTLVGAVLGVGIARGIGALNMDVVRSIFSSWLVTLPAGAGLAIWFFYVFKIMFK
jgi:PiT family inorganic phosphate transporter